MGNDLPDYQSEVSGTLSLPYLLLVGGTMEGTINMDSNKITNLPAPAANADAARKLDMDTVNAKLDDASLAQPARAVNTNYQNGAKLLLVVISVVLDAGEFCQLKIGAASPPATVVADAYDITSTIVTLVLPNYYYRLDTADTIGILRWSEFTLF